MVIVNHVPDVYAEFLNVSFCLALEAWILMRGWAKGQPLFDRFVDLVSGIFQPSLGALAAAGIIKGLVAILGATLGWNNDNSALYAILNAAE